MKKLSFAVIALTVFFAAFLSGCNDETTTPVGPTLQLLGGEYIDNDVTVAPGDPLNFSWLGTKGDANLKSFDIQVNGNHAPDFPVTDLPNDNYTGTASLEAEPNAGAYEYLFILTDNDNLSDSLSLTITVEPVGGPINTYTIELGSHQSASGSSFASTTGLVYQIADAKANATLIDFLYYYGATNEATLAAPDNAAAATVFSGATNGLATWSVLNSTKFRSTTLTATDFDNVADDLSIVANATGAADSDIKHIVQGNVVAFITDADKESGSKMGLVKITSIATGAAGSMQISVKVQQ